jgi:hypothetical protein
MADEQRNIAFAILGIIGVLAAVGLVITLTGESTGQVVYIPSQYGPAKLYGRAPGLQKFGTIENPYAQERVVGSDTPGAAWGASYGENPPDVAIVAGHEALYRVPTKQTTCPRGFMRIEPARADKMPEEQMAGCAVYEGGGGSLCCPVTNFQALPAAD